MSNSKISELLTGTTPLTGSEIVPIVQSGSTKKVPISSFSAYGPAFRAVSAANQSIGNATWTKVTLGTETFDTAGNFASDRFTPTVAGYYQVNMLVQINTTNYPVAVSLYKNGSIVTYSVGGYQSGILNGTVSHTDVIYMNGSTDYIEMYAYQSSGGSTTLVASRCVFSASLVRGQ